MNRYIRAVVCVPFGMIKMAWIKLFHFRSFSGPLICLVSPHTEITMERGSELRIGKNFKMRDGAKIRVREGAVCIIGDNSSINSSNYIVCHERIEIGNNVQLSPNVQIYDHDHDYRATGGLKAGKYKTEPILIGNNVWLGANVVILRGSEIGDNSIIGAGCIVKRIVPPNSVLINRKTVDLRLFNENPIC